MVAAEGDAEVRVQPPSLERGVVRYEFGAYLYRRAYQLVGLAVRIINLHAATVRDLDQP
jgi:hypothetical protein